MAKLYFCYASMKAGKSTTLLQADFNYRERGMNTLLFTSAIDARSGEGTIASRIGLSRPARAFAADSDLFVAVERACADGPVHCVLVDEAQFLTPAQVLQFVNVSAAIGIYALCQGLGIAI